MTVERGYYEGRLAVWMKPYRSDTARFFWIAIGPFDLRIHW